jgi:hypothetical protein
MREKTLPTSSSQTNGNEAGQMLSCNDLSDAIRGIRNSVTKLSNELDVLKRSRNRSNHPGTPTDSSERNFPWSTPQDIPTRVSSDSVPCLEVIFYTLRNNVLQGKYINLALLISPRDAEEQRVTDSDGHFILLKQYHDAILLKNLTLNLFIIAFTKYNSIICEVYPARQQELDAYEPDIVEMASTTRGSTFYEYHKAFSDRASALLLQRNVHINWSVRCTKLFTTIFSG